MALSQLPASLRSHLSENPLPIAESWRELLGDVVPEDLARHPIQSSGFLLGSPDELLEADNCFERAVELALEHEVMEPLFQAMTTTFFLANIPGDGDCLMAHIAQAGDLSQIAVWSHETGELSSPVAWDIPTVLRIVQVYASSDAVEARAELLAPALQRVDGKRWPFSFVGEQLTDSGVIESADQLHKPGTQPESALPALHDSLWWMACAILDEPIPKDMLAEDAGRSWDPDQATEEELAYPPVALFWLWLGYFLDAPWLDLVMDQLRNAESRLVRDAATLVDELLQGERTQIAGVDVTVARERVQQLIHQLEAPFPDTLMAGPLTFVRNDSRALDLALPPARPPSPPEPAEGQPDEPRWNDRILDVDPAGNAMLVTGVRNNPRFKGGTSVPRYIPSVFEIDNQGQVLMTADASDVLEARYLDAEAIVLCTRYHVQLLERHGEVGVVTESFPSQQAGSTVLADRKVILRYGGQFNTEKNAFDAERIEILQLEDGGIGPGYWAAIPATDAQVVNDELLVGNAERELAYQVNGLDELAAEAATGPLLRRTFAAETQLPARQGPQTALAQLNPLADWAFALPNQRCVVFKHRAGSDFEVMVGSDDGLHEVSPKQVGTMAFEVLEQHRGAVVHGSGDVWAIDSLKHSASHLFQLPGGYDDLGTMDGDFVQLHGGRLLYFNTAQADGDSGESFSIDVGPQASFHCVAEKRAIAIAAGGSPLVLLVPDVKAGGFRLISAVDPSGLATLNVETWENPRGFHRLAASVPGGRKLTVRGLGLALDTLTNWPLLDGELPGMPWSVSSLPLA